jgi:hypothetical protein
MIQLNGLKDPLANDKIQEWIDLGYLTVGPKLPEAHDVHSLESAHTMQTSQKHHNTNRYNF